MAGLGLIVALFVTQCPPLPEQHIRATSGVTPKADASMGQHMAAGNRVWRRSVHLDVLEEFALDVPNDETRLGRLTWYAWFQNNRTPAGPCRGVR